MSLADRMSLRISSEARTEFEQICAEHDRVPADVLRECIDAFNDGRLRILVPKNQPQPKQMELYQNDHRK